MLDITNLSVKKNKKHILKKVSLTIEPGQIHVLMGPNGSGKSMLAHAIAGDPDITTTGKIQLGNKDITKALPNERARKGLFLSFQNPVEIPGLRFAQFLRLAYNTVTGTTMDVKDFRKLLTPKAKEIGLSAEFIDKEVNTNLSGGEKKKMELLQMMTLKPKYIIVDEIDSGLDVDAVKIVAKQLKKLVKNGSGLLLITHYKRILEHLKPDKVSILSNGQISDTGGYELVNNIEKLGYDPIKNGSQV